MNKDTVRPFTKAATSTNTKCIIFSNIMMALYWFLPADKNIYLLPVIFVFSYVAMGWYDQLYSCNTKLLTGSRADFGTILDSIFKPQNLKKSELSDEELEAVIPDDDAQELIYRRNVYLFHVVAVVPLLIYIGYTGNKADPRAFGAVLGIAVLAGLYHSMRLVNPRT